LIRYCREKHCGLGRVPADIPISSPSRSKYFSVELKALNGHTGSVTSVAFSSDGTKILSGSGDKSVQVWDAINHIHATWTCDIDNWVISIPNKDRLMWVPKHILLAYPNTTLIILEVRAIAARGIYESLTIHCWSAGAARMVPLHNQSATEMVTSFGKAGTSYCAVIAGHTYNGAPAPV